MARRPSPPDEDDEVIPPRQSKPKRRPDADPVEDSSDSAEEDAPPVMQTIDARDNEPAPETRREGEKPLSELSDKGLLKRLMRYTEEFRMLAGDSTQAAVMRRVELTRMMRSVQDVRDAREPLVEVQVPASVTGEPFILGPLTFHPGLHRVRASIAQYLLWMIGENQRIELNRLKQNGRTIDLGTIGSRARMARIARDDGAGDYGGRGV